MRNPQRGDQGRKRKAVHCQQQREDIVYLRELQKQQDIGDEVEEQSGGEHQGRDFELVMEQQIVLQFVVSATRPIAVQNDGHRHAQQRAIGHLREMRVVSGDQEDEARRGDGGGEHVVRETASDDVLGVAVFVLVQ